MRLRVCLQIQALTVCAALVLAATFSSSSALALSYQEQPKPQPTDKSQAPQASEGENKAAMKIKNATDPAAKAQAVSEFLKKYPKSTLRPMIARHIAGEISKLQDPTQQITLSEGFLTMFNEPGEADLVTPILIDAYSKANRSDDAFRVAAAWIAKNPNDVPVLTQMALIGTEQVKRQNKANIQTTQQYGLKAIELIEADKKPDTLEAERWGEYKTRWLPYLYHSMGIVLLMSGNKQDATAKFEKAASLNVNDPFTYALLSDLYNEEYQKLAEQHKSLMSGPLKDEALKRAEAKLDQIIDLYAHAVALSEGNPQYQPLKDQLMGGLTQYYKYRHNGSTDGLQQLIDKYKRQ